MQHGGVLVLGFMALESWGCSYAGVRQAYRSFGAVWERYPPQGPQLFSFGIWALLSITPIRGAGKFLHELGLRRRRLVCCTSGDARAQRRLLSLSKIGKRGLQLVALQTRHAEANQGNERCPCSYNPSVRYQARPARAHCFTLLSLRLRLVAASSLESTLD